MEELQNNIVIYNPSDDINLEVRVAEDTVWLTQAQMAKLLGTTSQNITLDTGDAKAIQTMCVALKKIHEIEKAARIS